MSLYSVSAVSASSINGAGYEAANAVDMVAHSNAGKRWAAAAGAPQWLQLDLGTAQVVDYYSLIGGLFSTTQDPSAWTFEGSNNGTTWTTLDTQSSITFSNLPRSFYAANSTAYRYYRINVSATAGGVVSISEFRVGTHETSGISIAQSSTSNIDNASSGTVSIASTPAANQVIIVSIACNRTDVTASGLGATWTQIANSMTSAWLETHSVWVGRGATSSGNITISGGGAFNAQVLALVTNCDGTNIAMLGNGSSGTASYGQIVLGVIYEDGGGTPTLGGTTTPSAASWTQTTMFTPPSNTNHRIKQAYIVASSGTYGTQWTGLGAASSNTIILGFPSVPIAVVENVYLEAMDTGTISAQVESLYLESADTGTLGVQVETSFLEVVTQVQPAQVESVYTETLINTTPPVQAESVYTEALLNITPPTQVESQYIEVLVQPIPGPLPFKGWGSAI